MPAPRKTESLTTPAPRSSELGPPADPTLYLPRVEPGRLFGVLLRRGWIVAMATAAAVGAMVLYAKNATPVYVADGSVEVKSQTPRPLNIDGLTPGDTKDLEQLRTIEGNMVSRAVLQRVIEKNGLATATDFAPPGITATGLVELLGSRFHVELERGKRRIAVRVEDTDPVRAKVLVESLVTEYESWVKENREELANRTGEGLALEEEKLRSSMKEAAAKLQEFREQNPVPGLETLDGSGPASDPLGALQSQLVQAKGERLRLESEYESFRKFDPSDPASLGGIASNVRSEDVLTLSRALQAKELEFARTKERYLYKHPVHKEIAREVEALKEDLATAVQTAGKNLEKSYHVALENETKLSSELEGARATAIGVEGVRAKFGDLKREADAARELHATVDRRLRETMLASAVAMSAIEWVQPPVVPEKAARPAKKILFPLAGFMGMAGGLLLVVGLELKDSRVRDSAAAARATGAPLLASLPSISGGGREGDMVLLSDPGSPVAEAFRRLRAVLLPPPAMPDARTILFASAAPGEGRSLCALNHAVSLALQGQRTLLLDADMRRPGLSREHLKNGFGGLGDHLEGDTPPARACFPTAVPNLYLLSSGPMRDDAAELLAGTRFPALLEDAYRWFDAVVIDSPPVLAVSDALALSRYADRVCLVVRQGATERKNLRKATELIRSSGGNVVGFVWNELPWRAKSQSAPEPFVPYSQPALADKQESGSTSAIA